MADTENEILDALLALRDAGRAPDLGELEQRFPGRRRDIERIWRATERYERDLPEVDASCGVGAGDQLGDFLIERLLGAGGMGHVFLARQLSLGKRPVALKVLPAALQSEVNLKRFEREAAFLAELHHPRLAEVYGFGEERGVHYIAMRFVAGRTLHEVLRELAAGGEAQALPGHVLRWAVDLGEALATVHRAGLMHRDVKPSNILVEDPTFSGHAVLVDFGLVRAMQSNERTQTGYSAATPAYASPEQLLSLELDPSSDVFSLGVTLHDLLTRRLPGDRGQASAGLEPLERLYPDVDPDLAAVIAKMVETDVRWRYADADELLVDLYALQSGEMVSARFPPLLERLRRSVQREPARFVRAGVLALLVTAVFLLGSVLLDARGLAREALRAWEQGDVPGLMRSAVSLDAAGMWFLGDSPTRHALEDLRSPGDQTALGRVGSALREGDVPAALREAATPLRRDGINSSELLARYLWHALDEEAQELAGRGRGEFPVLRMVTRLFFERPTREPADLQASAPFRRALLERWERADLSVDERLLVLSAFSGVGLPGDLMWILAWSREQPVYCEPARLAFQVSERILRRGMLLGELESVDQDALRRLVIDAATPACRDLHGPVWKHPRTKQVGFAAAELVCALGILRRHLGLDPGVGSVVDAMCTDPKLEGKYFVVLLRAVNLEPNAIEAIGEGRYLWGLQPKAFHSWGIRCGLLGDAVDEGFLQTRAGERVRDLDEPLRSECLAQFEVGKRQGLELLEGKASHLEPDEDTRLGAGAEADEWVEFSSEDRGEPPVPAEDAAQRIVALWRVLPGSMATWGPFEAPSGRFARPAIDERFRGYLRLSQPGLSEFRIRLRIDEDPGLADWTIVVRYQTGLRSYVPHCGEASFELRIDGKPLERAVALFVRDLRDHVLELPLELLPVGEHELSLRLGPTTNTTFRLAGIEIRAPRR